MTKGHFSASTYIVRKALNSSHLAGNLRQQNSVVDSHTAHSNCRHAIEKMLN